MTSKFEVPTLDNQSIIFRADHPQPYMKSIDAVVLSTYEKQGLCQVLGTQKLRQAKLMNTDRNVCLNISVPH